MSVSLCIEVDRLPASAIARTLDLLLALDVDLYRAGVVKQPPWGLLWVPDQLVICDANACRFADISKLQDVAVLQRRRQGSCGPLACAYAAWLHVHERAASSVQLQQGASDDEWHVVARVGSTIYDPQTIGAR